MAQPPVPMECGLRLPFGSPTKGRGLQLESYRYPSLPSMSSAQAVPGPMDHWGALNPTGPWPVCFARISAVRLSSSLNLFGPSKGTSVWEYPWDAISWPAATMDADRVGSSSATEPNMKKVAFTSYSAKSARIFSTFCRTRLDGGGKAGIPPLLQTWYQSSTSTVRTLSRGAGSRPFRDPVPLEIFSSVAKIENLMNIFICCHEKTVRKRVTKGSSGLLGANLISDAGYTM